MMIQYLKPYRQFQIDTEHMSYVMTVADEGYLLHTYWGKKLAAQDLTDLLRLNESPFTPLVNDRERASFLDSAPFEYPCGGIGDYREAAFEIETLQGYRACDLRYVSHRIFSGKHLPADLPHTFGDSSETLEITLRDHPTGVTVLLYYTVFSDSDALIRSATIRNDGTETCTITRALSASVDFDDDRFDMLTLYGSWARERQVDRLPLRHGKQRADSLRGESSHQYSPFFALMHPNADEQQGTVYGMTLIYSGNFMLQAELTQHCTTRAQIGIHPDAFSWELLPQAEFETPEAVLVYSTEGLGGMSRCFHALFSHHLIRSVWRDRERPVLVNNWEATYFDFDVETLTDLSRQAAQLGIEMLVLDDGWFGHRDSDNSSLGDWTPHPRKFPNGLKPFTDAVTASGMKFGIWMEPEMVSPDSTFYREHPEWVVRIPNRPMTLCRAQYVLDMSRKEVRDAIWEQIKALLDSVPISYVKWDMNRQLTEPGSLALPANRQREFFHRYQLGVYELLERLVTEYPEILLESCSGGGARFDAGMLYYSPQIWASDDTDARERLRIQYGASLFLPPSAMGAHVSVCPNHAAGRNTPFETRAHVAMNGTFGYELDVRKLSKEEKEQIPAQIAQYHRISWLLREGLQYRLGNPFEMSHTAAQTHSGWDAWSYVSPDRMTVLMTYVQISAEPNMRSRRIPLAGLLPETVYHYELDGKEYTKTGAYLMQCGIMIPNLFGDMKSRQVLFQAVEESHQ